MCTVYERVWKKLLVGKKKREIMVAEWVADSVLEKGTASVWRRAEQVMPPRLQRG